MVSRRLSSYRRKLIDRLALALLQYGTIEDEELAMIKEAADLQKRTGRMKPKSRINRRAGPTTHARHKKK